MTKKKARIVSGIFAFMLMVIDIFALKLIPIAFGIITCVLAALGLWYVCTEFVFWLQHEPEEKRTKDYELDAPDIVCDYWPEEKIS